MLWPVGGMPGRDAYMLQSVKHGCRWATSKWTTSSACEQSLTLKRRGRSTASPPLGPARTPRPWLPARLHRQQWRSGQTKSWQDAPASALRSPGASLTRQSAFQVRLELRGPVYICIQPALARPSDEPMACSTASVFCWLSMLGHALWFSGARIADLSSCA